MAIIVPGPRPLRAKPYPPTTPAARALNQIGDKWALLIVQELVDGPVRFVELQRRLDRISTEQLRTVTRLLVADGIATKTRYREVPPRVDYTLTDKGRALVGVLAALGAWGRDWATEPEQAAA